MFSGKSAASKWMALLLVLVLAPAVRAAESAPPIPLEAFAKKNVFTALKLSPDGTMVAALVPGARAGAIAVLSVPELKAVGGVRLTGDQQFVRVWWAGDKRLVAELGFRDGPLDPLSSTGDIVTFDATGRDLRYVIGQQGIDGKIGSRLGKKTLKRVWATVIDPLIDDPNHVIISSREINTGEDSKAVVSRLDLRTSKLETLAVAPAAGFADFLLDRQGQVRFVSVSAGPFQYKTWKRDVGQEEWQPLEKEGEFAKAEPVAFAEDGKSVFLASRHFGDRSCLVRQMLDTGALTKVACHEAADLDHTIDAFAIGGEPIAAVFEAGKPETRLLDTGHPNIELLKLLQAAFPGKQIRVASATRDGGRLLVTTQDDRTTADYYLFDTKSRNAQFLTAELEWLDPELMAARQPVSFKSRDGTPLHGYLTIPRGSNGKNLPLIVHPHGGPFGIREHWTFDPEPQMLASRGYAVLQVNFRGSGGFGFEFSRQGRRAWGTTMIDDLTDSLKGLIAQGVADPARVCIYGGSYGGYAAMMSAVREPELYRCVVAEAGIYDLKLWRDDSDVADSDFGKRYLEAGVAANEAEMIAQSPLTYIDKLKAPVLVIHGEEDRRTPFSQAKALRKALDARKLPYEWLVKAGEGHGFIDEGNILTHHQTLLAFLDRHIGAKP